jgi:hypothetical protein
MSDYRVSEEIDNLYVQKNIYRDTQLRLESGMENVEDCIIQLSKIIQELSIRVRRLEDIMCRNSDF